MAAIDILRDILAKRKKPGEVKAEKLPLGTVADLSPRQEETVTLGGTEEVPMDGSLAAVRPRVVPNQPINADVPRPPQPRELDNGGAFDVGVPYADVLAQAPQTPPNLNDPRQRAKYLESKQYNPGEYRKRDGSITNNPNDPDVVETVREPGKDRDKKWSLGEKIGSFFLGMFDGTGAIPAAMDRNYLERRQDRRELADTYGTIQRQQAVEKGDLANQEQVLQNDYLAMRPQIEQQKVDVAADRVGVAARRADIAERTQGWKEEDRKKYWEWEEIKLKAKQESDARTFALAERKQAELERSNRAKEGQAARNEVGRLSRAQLQAETRRVLAELQDATRKGMQDKAIAARERLAQIKNQVEGLP